MAESANQKITSIRRNMRKTQVEQYREKIRKQIMESRMQTNQSRQLNQVILNLIQKEKLLDIAQLIYSQEYSNLKQPLSNLTPDTSLILFNYLSKQMSQLYSLIILGNLIESQYATIFLNKNNEQICVQFIRKTYIQIDKAVRMWTNCQQQGSQKQQKYNYLNGSLGILKALVYNRDQKHQQLLFMQIQHQQLIPQFLVKWLQHLINHPKYLIMLTILQYENNLSNQQPLKSMLTSRPQILIKLIQQGDPSGNWHKSLPLPSITFANSCMKNIDDKSVIIKCILPYFHITKIVYKYSQPGKEQYYKFMTFVQLLKTLLMLIQKIAEEPLQPNIGMLMCRQNFWAFISVILRMQTLPIRQIFHQIIKLAVQNIIVSGAKLQDFISQLFIGFIMEGLDYKHQSIIVCSLQTCSLIVNYCQKTQNYAFLKIMYQHDFDCSLDNLKYSQQSRIAKLSNELAQSIQTVDKLMEQEK